MILYKNISFGFCDVRDVALAHLRAMKKPEAAGNRHLIVDGSESHTFKDVALALDAEFQDKGYKVPLTVAPNCIIKILSIFDRKIRSVHCKKQFKHKYSKNLRCYDKNCKYFFLNSFLLTRRYPCWAR